jgi:methylated-DNA-[protein]-cysteine S-methyltransferase
MARQMHSSPAANQHYRLFPTAMGVCGVAWTETGLSRVQLPERDARSTQQALEGRMAVSWPAQPPPHVALCIAMLQRYFEGVATDFHAVELDQHNLSIFHRHVYAALRDVGFGQTTTYGALARRVGAPGSARAVGTAMSHNPWPIVVPCHRVLAAANKIGGFSAFGRTTTKRHLLGLEGVELCEDHPVLPGLFS